MICDKISYKNKAEARNAIQGIADEDGEHLHQYTCEDCGCIHLTTAGSKKIKNINRIGGEKWRYVKFVPLKDKSKKKTGNQSLNEKK